MRNAPDAAALCAKASFILQVILVALQIKVTTILASTFPVLFAESVAASVLALFFLLGLFSVLFQRHFHSSIPSGTVSLSCGVLLLLASHALTLYTLCQTRQSQSLQTVDSNGRSGVYVDAAIAFWVLTGISHIVFFALLFRQTASSGLRDASNLEEGLASSSDPATKQALIQSTLPHNLAIPSSSNLTPCNDLTPTSRSSSITSSIVAALRPITSQTRLLGRPSNTSVLQHSPHSPSVDPFRERDGFENWEMTVPDRSKTARPPQLSKTLLETIPGSRPVSPAKALDGPFTAPPTSHSPGTIHDSHQDTSSRPYIKRQLSSTELSIVQNRASSLHPPCPGNAVHPLFRSESPHPPPVASSNTVITASPFAGQVISSESIRGRRPDSRPDGISPYVNGVRTSSIPEIARDKAP